MAEQAPSFTITDDAPRRKPGRPKGSTNTSTTATAINQDVKKALATLDSIYSLMGTGLMVMGLSQSATDWADSAEQLSKTNEDALRANPKLAKMIGNIGSTGGSITFFITHGMAVLSLAKTVRNEIQDKRLESELAKTPVPDYPD